MGYSHTANVLAQAATGRDTLLLIILVLSCCAFFFFSVYIINSVNFVFSLKPTLFFIEQSLLKDEFFISLPLLL